MKSRVIVLLLSVAAIIGYAFYKKAGKTNKSFKPNEDKSSKDDLASKESNNSVLDKKDDDIKTVDDGFVKVQDVKAVVESSIAERHEEAAKIMKDSINKIFEDTTSEVLSENEEAFEEIDDALSKMMNE